VKINFKHLISTVLLFTICLSCSDNAPEPDSEGIDSSCELEVVYRDNKSSSVTSTVYVDSGYGSDRVEYRELADSSLVYYMTFEYNGQNQVTLSKRFDMNDVLESEKTIEYWPSGEKKMIKTERKKIETLSDKTNAIQESYFDEKGNIEEYKNFNISGSIVYHTLYTNTYEGDKLVEAYRDHLVDRHDATLEYTYNSEGLIQEILTKDINGEVTFKTEYEYSDDMNEVKRYSNGGTSLSGSEKTFFNENDTILKTQSLSGDGSIRVEHSYSYNCSN
tara:strand:+ start:19014 stop:19841 length:828 start_codon:yes stop_codon:yes gene_type:complete